MSLEKLTTLIQNAHAGERAAALAYRGHQWSVKRPQEKDEILKIEEEEWTHRRSLRRMLTELGSSPRWGREFVMMVIGSKIAFFCLLGRVLNFFGIGWYMSMFGAGLFEKGNIVEYEVAARYAYITGRIAFVEPLLHMAEVEWDHEKYFREKCLTSKWVKWIRTWNPPPPREKIQSDFSLFKSQNPVQISSSQQAPAPQLGLNLADD